MATLTLSTIRSLLRNDLNDSGTVTLTDAELNTLINDGYKDVCVKGCCYESKITKSNIPTGVSLVPLVGLSVIRVNYVAYDTGTGEKGMLRIVPQALGANPLTGATPQHWFQWGPYLVIEPTPDVATYDLFVYASCYPATVLSNDTDTPSAVPAEFHECVYRFSMAYANLKLRRWGRFATAYNEYIIDLQAKREEYIAKHPDPREIKRIPNFVEVQRA